MEEVTADVTQRPGLEWKLASYTSGELLLAHFVWWIDVWRPIPMHTMHILHIVKGAISHSELKKTDIKINMVLKVLHTIYSIYDERSSVFFRNEKYNNYAFKQEDI